MRRLFVLGLGVAVACAGADGAGDRRTLIDSRDNYDPRSLDPARSTDVPTGRAVGYLFDGLTRFTPDAKVEPGLAERWEVSPDGMTYTFHLRRGVKFHDGKPFVARHVLHSWQRVLDPAVRGGRGWPLYPVRGARDYAERRGQAISGLTAPNDSTVVVSLTEPFAIFPKLLAMPVAAIVPDPLPANFEDRPIGTGPWKFAEWKRDDYLLFAKNADYWGGAPKMDSLRARIIAEPSTAVAEFESGNVDVLMVPQGEAQQWQESPDRRRLLQSVPALQLIYIGVNTTRGPLADRRVRQALNHAVNVDAIISQLVSGRGRRAVGVIPPTLEGADTTRTAYAFDVNRAKQLLAEAGHANGIDVDLWTPTTPIYVRIAEAVQGFLQAANIRAKIVQRESAAAREAARNGQTDLILKDWYADYPDAENFLYPLLHGANKGVGGNVSFYGNAEFDRIVTASRREQDAGRRAQLYRQADSIAYQDAPMIYLYFFNELYAVQPWIKGFRIPTIFNGQRWTEVEIAGNGQE
ncbi:MAG: ABC transporter substrate-binding protein [Gemmatimonadaceae bacterium]